MRLADVLPPNPREPHWLLVGHWGEQLALPAAPAGTQAFAIGTLGTRTRHSVKDKTRRLAAVLGALRRPVYVLDTRRHGVGAQGSWSPRELATVVPELAGEPRFGFLHLPDLAPPLPLLESHRAAAAPPWQAFAAAFREALPPFAVAAARAFVEAGAATGGLAILLCAEELRPDFDALPQEEQESCYCHRFTLAALVREALAAAHPGARVERVDLEIR